jgi:hypothetical protein
LKSGFLYIVTNTAFPGFVKVGVTENLHNRLRVYQTSDPSRGYKMEFSVSHPDVYEAERRIKDVMTHFALSQRNEWFEVDLEFAKSRLVEQVDAYKNGEWTAV